MGVIAINRKREICRNLGIVSKIFLAVRGVQFRRVLVNVIARVAARLIHVHD